MQIERRPRLRRQVRFRCEERTAERAERIAAATGVTLSDLARTGLKRVVHDLLEEMALGEGSPLA